MSLKKCPECGNLVSSDVKQCIHCGKKLLDSSRLIGNLIIVLFIAFIFLIVMISVGGNITMPFK